MEITAVILAGGKSSRMGKDKGLIEVNGKPMIQHAIDTLQELKVPILIVANNPLYEQFNCPVFSDEIPDKGPLGGIYTALMHAETESVLILSCDTPFITEDILKKLIIESIGYSVIVASDGEREHPLIGVYHKAALGKIKQSLATDQLKLSDMYHGLRYKVVEFDAKSHASSFMNINTHDDLKHLGE